MDGGLKPVRYWSNISKHAAIKIKGEGNAHPKKPPRRAVPLSKGTAKRRGQTS
jgi:hypothetical protein